MNNISRRSFLKFTGVAAFAVMSASALSGCELTHTVTVTIEVGNNDSSHPVVEFSTEFPTAVKSIDSKTALNLVNQHIPEAYKGKRFKLNDKVKDNCKVVQGADGRYTLTIAVVVVGG